MRRNDNPPYYLTAYGLAVKHGFMGTEEEWLESLIGAIPLFEIGEVITLPGGSDAEVSITGTAANPVLNFGIPRGIDMVDALMLSGGSMHGNIAMNSNKVTGLGTPTEDGDAVPKIFLDTKIKKVTQDKVSKINNIAILLTTGWINNTQTVTVDGVTEDNTVIVGAEPACYTAYADNNVRCTGQGAGTLTFVCDDVPTEDLTANVLILYQGETTA